MSTFSMNLRERIVAACLAGESQVWVSHRFGVCAKTVQRYVARASQGELAPRPIPGRPSRLRPDQEGEFLALFQERKAGCSLLYLPPYSSDLSPIELAWSWIKNRVRTLSPRDDQAREDCIDTANRQLNPDAATGWFRKCGLC